MSEEAEQAALEHLAMHKELGIEYSDGVHIGIFLAGAEWGRQPPQWINVEDKLPERRKGVLLYHDVWGITRGYLNETSPEIAWRDERGDAIETSSVLYWMPLPAAPEGHSNE